MGIVPEVMKNQCDGIDAKLTASHIIGDQSQNITGGILAAASTSTSNQLTTGAFAGCKSDGHGLSLSHLHTTGVGSVTTGAGNLNLLQNQTHSLNANALKSHTSLNNGLKYDSTEAGLRYNHIQGHGLSINHLHKTGVGSVTTGAANLNLLQDQTQSVNANAFTSLNNGLKYDTIGAGLGYNHVQGHAVSVTASQIPQIGGTTVGVGANVNIFKAADKAGSIDLGGSVSKTFGGPMDGQKNYLVGLGYTHRFK